MVRFSWVMVAVMLVPAAVYAADDEADQRFTVYVTAAAPSPGSAIPKDVLESVSDVRRAVESSGEGVRPAESDTDAEVLLEIVSRSSKGGKAIEARLTVFDRLDGVRLLGQGSNWKDAAGDMVSGLVLSLADRQKEMAAARAGSAPRPAAVRLVRHGDALMAAGEADAALEAWDEALSISAKYAGALRRRGQARVARNEHARALVDLDAALAAGPADPEAYLARARAHGALGHATEARADLRALAEHIPRGTPLGVVAASDVVDLTAGELSERSFELERVQDAVAAQESELGEEVLARKRREIADKTREQRILIAVLAACKAGDEMICGLLRTRLEKGVARLDEPPRPRPLR